LSDVEEEACYTRRSIATNKKKYHPADEGRELFLVLLKKKISLAV